uniref:Aspartate/glutamate/uridylate kinase domain-containing protein n=1 Tax=Coccolithus braarudii TaxID=221442 RepID=A0A7S0L8K2_9EUKA|mmetsp:Transcript_24071/g.51902  ORF Transcript_24071/g.51902 Transcript_24071/m.51902 type:complete len:401 (+) Transcript_24071:20-1222(+)
MLIRSVCKFGGSSVADRAGIARVAALVKAPEIRREHLVVSAPGKCHAADVKVTDILLQAHAAAKARSRLVYDALMGSVASRFSQLSSSPDLAIALESLAASVYDDASSRPLSDAAFAASRGEYLNGLVMAHETGYEFVDPADDFLIFNESHELDLTKSLAAIRRRCASTCGVVIPGFFGSVGGVASPATVATFSRGGSDVTASIVAAALAEEATASGAAAHAVVHENFTDVDGVLTADPRVCPAASRIPRLSYTQTRSLALAGAAVLHADALESLIPLAVPIHVRSTWEPHGEGTWISLEPARLVFDGMHESDERLARGIALSVASEGEQVTVVCREVDHIPRAERAARALRFLVQAALDAKGIARLGPAESTGPQVVCVHLADRGQLNVAVATIFDCIN